MPNARLPSLTALGELLIDFTPLKNSGSANPCFEQNPGGAPANVLACFAKLGGKAAFIGAVGKDSFGHFLSAALDAQGVSTRGLVKLVDRDTTLAFVHLDKNGDRSFSFYRRPGADTCLEPSDVDVNLIAGADIFHFGSLSLTAEPVREATFFAAETARKNGKLISFDPNWRPALWESPQEAVKLMQKSLPYADVLKVSEEEAFMLTGEKNSEKAAKKLFDGGVPLVLVTLGPDGCCFCGQNGAAHVPTFNIPAVDTTGAGDAFWGAFLFKLAMLHSAGSSLASLSKADLRALCLFANASGSLCASRRGAIPALASLAEIEALLKTGNTF